MVHNSYTMSIHGLPEPSARVHIRQPTHVHGITMTCTHIRSCELCVSFANFLSFNLSTGFSFGLLDY